MNKTQLHYNISLEENKILSIESQIQSYNRQNNNNYKSNIEVYGFYEKNSIQSILLEKDDFEKELQKGKEFENIVLYKGEKRDIKDFPDLSQLYEQYKKNNYTIYIIILYAILTFLAFISIVRVCEALSH